MGVVTMVITAIICLLSLSGAYIHHVQMDMEVMADILCDGYEQDHQFNFSQFSNYDMRITLISPEELYYMKAMQMRILWTIIWNVLKSERH